MNWKLELKIILIFFVHSFVGITILYGLALAVLFSLKGIIKYLPEYESILIIIGVVFFGYLLIKLLTDLDTRIEKIRRDGYVFKSKPTPLNAELLRQIGWYPPVNSMVFKHKDLTGTIRPDLRTSEEWVYSHHIGEEIRFKYIEEVHEYMEIVKRHKNIEQ